ncbi:thyrotropin-releasing hormone receptor-like [Rhincodon typus]|uniref:thyrotropin-releasing hormone receptor-like n=1 Tax=Rhincodon typus TaxID=259920 RepID=UPI00202E3D8B|nr:thyrotropin-releasing hormone receptor-like [Rhincodon typus]
MHAILTGPVFNVYYPVLAAIGVPANLVVIVILSKRRCGLSRCINCYLVSIAVADLLVVVTVVILNRTAGIYFPFSFLSITPMCSLRSALNYAALDATAWLTVAFTFDRFVAISCHKLKITYCTEKMAAWIIAIISAVACVKNAFLYFQYEPMYMINNTPWFCSIKIIVYTSPAWAANDWIAFILTPLLPFILIILLNALTVSHILAANRSRKRIRFRSNAESQSDREMVKRRKSIVLLFTISGSFVLLYLLCFIWIPYVRFANVIYTSVSNFSNSTFIIQETGFMLQLLSSCINPFIYAGTQSKFRTELQNGLKYPMNLFIKVFKI